MAAIDTSTIELLLKTGKQLATVEVKDFPNDPERRLIIMDGKFSELPTPRRDAKRKHVVRTVSDFVQAFEALLAKDDATEAEAAGELPLLTPSPIWFDTGRVVVFVDDRFRDESIELPLPATEQMQLLEKLAKGVGLEQKQLVRMLRHDLAGCVDGFVLTSFRTFDWEQNSRARSVIEKNRQSFDSDVTASIAGPEKPEQFTITCPLIDHQDFRDVRHSVDCTVDYDFDSRKVLLQLLPGELTRAKEAALSAVRIRLESELPEEHRIAGAP